MNEETQFLISRLRMMATDIDDLDDPELLLDVDDAAVIINEAADALEAATERASQAEAELRDVLRVDIPSLKAERDAALAVIERVRAIHMPVDVEPSETVCHGCSTLRGTGENVRYFPYEEWPCPTVAALDGAPEPEGRWEYRGRLQSCGYVAEGYVSAEHAMNGLKVELEDHPYLVMDDTAIVERARVREWLPVEGENK